MGAGRKEKGMGLSPFQVEKLQYYFNFFDADGNGKLEKKDLGFIMKRILDFTGWARDSVQANRAAEVHETFFEVLFERADEDANHEIDMNEWMHMWEKLLPGTMGMCHFPVWMRLLPDTLFHIIDRNEDGVIDQEELAMYYEKMCDVNPQEAKTQAAKAMDQMTDNGAYPLDIVGFEQVFANFLIGRTPFGPGRFLFACFSHRDPQFQLIEPFKEQLQENDYKQRRHSGAKILQKPTPKLQALS